MADNVYIPVYLVRKGGEEEPAYVERITKFLKDFEVSRLNEILGEIDPLEKENDDLIEFMKQLIQEKKEDKEVKGSGESECNLI
jgi:uncharacterized protein Yka (UPF0111/DUF47 family)